MRRVRVDDDQEVHDFHGLFHLGPARLAVGCVPPEEHRPDVVFLGDVFLVFEDAVDPA